MFNGIEMIGSLLLTVHGGGKAVLSVTNELFAHLLASSVNVNRSLCLITSTRHSRAQTKTKTDDAKDHKVLQVRQCAAVAFQGIRFRTHRTATGSVPFWQDMEGLALSILIQ